MAAHPAPPLEELNQLSILWGGEFALEVAPSWPLPTTSPALAKTATRLRYPSDLTDAESAHIEPLIPPGKPGGG